METLQRRTDTRIISRRPDGLGVVLVLECVFVDEAKRILSEFPLVKADLIEFEFIPTMAFTPFEHLFVK